MTKIEKRTLIWFRHLETVDEEKLTEHIYKSRVNKADEGQPRRAYEEDQRRFKKGLIKSR